MQKNRDVVRLVLCSLFIALGVVLGGALSIPAFPMGVYSLKIGVGVLPVILSGILFGPVYGGIAGGLTDILQAFIFPKGAYMPWFTIVGVLFGLIPGLFFAKGQRITFLRLLCAVGTGQVVGSVICNTILITLINQLPLEVVLIPRAINQAVMIPLYTVLLYYIVPLASKLYDKMRVKRE